VALSGFGPLLLKELFGASRRGQMYWGRVIYIGLIGLIIYQFWSTEVSALLSPSAFAALSRRLFRNFVFFQLVTVSLAAVGGAAERVIREEANQTLGLLLLTPLTARGISYSKWTASMIQAGSLMLCGLPVVAVCVYLGGVGLGELLWSFSLIGAMAALGAAFGLRASATCRSIPRAIIVGFLYLVGYALLPIPLIIVTIGTGLWLIPFLHPLYAAGAMEIHSGSNDFWQYCWIPATLLSFLVSWLVVRKLAVRIRNRTVAPQPASPNFVYEQKHLLGRFRVPLKVGSRPSRSYREVWESNPLLWKELLTHASSRWTRESKLGYLIVALLFILIAWAITLGENQGTLAFLGIFFAMLAVANGAALFAPEKEGRRMEMLLSAPISSASIVRSKLLSGLIAPEPIRVSLVALVTVLAFSYWSGLVGVLLHLVVFFGFMGFAFTLAAAASLRAATIHGAALGATAVLCVILLVVPMLVSIARPGESFGPWTLLEALNPVWALEPLQQRRSMDLAAAGGRCSLFVLNYFGASAGLLGWMLWRFDRMMGRI
jgi:hypothetical protein